MNRIHARQSPGFVLAWLPGGAAGPPGSGGAFGLAVDDAEIDVGEAHEPIAGLGFDHTDGFAGEGLADEDELAAPFDLTA
jgi:hypothetical protein